MAEIRIVRDYPQPPEQVWRALTDPTLIPRWTSTGAGGRPEGFAPVAGTKFRFVAKPKPGWNGVVDCEVLEVNEPSLLRYSWTGDSGGDVTQVPAWPGKDYDTIFVFKITNDHGQKSFSFTIDHEGLNNLSDEYP